MSPDSGLPHQRDGVPVSHIEERAICAPRLPAEVTEYLTPAEQTAFFCTLVDSAIDAIIAHRPDGFIVYANQGAADLLGYSADEMMALSPYGWVGPEMMAGGPRRVEAILHEGRLAFHSSAARKDGSILPTEVTSNRVETALGPIIVAVIRDMRDRLEAQQALEYMAYHDSLTGLGNRAYFDDRIGLAIADAKRHGDLLGLAYIDLDEFKPINDRYGHAVGDEVLIEIGKRLCDDVREQDTVARLGGDEFVLVLPRLCSTSELPIIAKRLVGRIEEPMVALGYDVRVRGTIGLALFDAARDDARSLLVKADVAMYSAKNHPQHPWLIYDERMNAIEHRPGT